jgi:16S rRNA (adenine1518-N6/adenine1519-N6)-dimethyltransferase
MGFQGHQARKRFGQHWLKDQMVLDRIVAAADLQSSDRVLEVGPGRGALTELLLASPAAAVHAVELDRDLVDGLRDRFGGDPRFSLCQGDVLELPLQLEDGVAAKVVANIPYNITGPLLDRLVGRLDRPVDPPYQRLVLLVQKEVAERIRARPGHSSFSALSVRMQLMARCTTVCPVPPRCFQPPPKVQSEVIQIDPLPSAQRLSPALARRVESLLKQAFLARRKMLRNTLASLAPEPQLQELAAAAGFHLQQRPQELAPQTWVALARGLNQGTDAASADGHDHGDGTGQGESSSGGAGDQA